MQISGKAIDDFKTDRKGVSPPLPAYLRIVPILFYLSILASIMLNGIFIIRYGQAGRGLEEATARNRQIQTDLQATKDQRKDLEDQAKRASDIVSWVDAARPLQPLIVEIARSVGVDSTIAELRLDRDAENPVQIRLSLRLGSDTTKQLDLTLAKIADQQFRSFSPQQTVANGEIEYKATLMWQGSAEKPAPHSAAP